MNASTPPKLIPPFQSTAANGTLPTEQTKLMIATAGAKHGYAGWTIRQTQGTLGKILGRAARRGLIPSNPASRLERGELASVGRREQRVLRPDEIQLLLDHAPSQFRTLLSTAVSTGMRLGELLGRVWDDIDFDAGFIHVRKQLDRNGTETGAEDATRAARDCADALARRSA